MKLLKLGFLIYIVTCLLANTQGFNTTDADFTIPEIPYIPDKVAIAKQDSIVRRAFIKKDTTPYKGHWIDINR